MNTRGLFALLASSAVVQAAGIVLTLALGIVLARTLGPASYGVYGLAMSVVSIAVIPAQFGLPLFGTREAAATPHTDLHLRRSVLRWFGTRSLLFALAISLAVLLGLASVTPSWAVQEPSLMPLCAALIWSSAVLAVLAAVLRGFGGNLAGQIIEILVRPALILMIVYVAATRGMLDTSVALSAQLTATIGCLLVIVFHLLRTTEPGNGRSTPPYRPERWLPVAVSITSAALLAALNGNYPLLVAGLYVSGEPLGILRVALSSAGLLALPWIIANTAAGPVIARQFAEHDTIALARSTSLTTIVSFLLTAGGLVFLAIFGKLLITLLFGAEYQDAYLPLLILGTGQLITSSFGISGVFLNLTGRHVISTHAFIFAVPAGLLTSLALTSVWGINGAAIGTVMMAAVWHGYVFIIKGAAIDAPLSLPAAVRAAWRLR